jgi:hypothetical protein
MATALAFVAADSALWAAAEPDQATQANMTAVEPNSGSRFGLVFLMFILTPILKEGALEKIELATANNID